MHLQELEKAMMTDDVLQTALLLETVPDINGIYTEFLGGPILFYAIRWCNNPIILEMIIDKGADIHKRYGSNDTALMYACSSGESLSVRTLINNGADVEERFSSGYTPLIVSTRRRHPGIMKVLIESGANINSTDNHGSTALHHAAMEDNIGAANLLINSGANISILNKSGRTAYDIFHKQFTRRNRSDILKRLSVSK